MLVDITKRDTSTTVLGHRLEFPVMLSPAGQHGRAHPEAELASARAAGSVGTAMIVSGSASFKLEDVAKAAKGPIWLQMHLYRDRGLTKSLADRASAAGYSALCITVDSPVSPKRERHVRTGFKSPPAPNYGGMAAESLIDGAATWDYLQWLASSTSLPLVPKGIMTAEDARLCLEHGAQAVIVSNHGGRKLDTTFTTPEVLPEVVEATAGRAEVYVDGGIRRGTDVLKALAMGARAVLVGRPVFWGLAVGGEAGVREVLEILRDELDLAMAMCGRPNISSIDSSLLGTVSPLVSRCSYLTYECRPLSQSPQT